MRNFINREKFRIFDRKDQHPWFPVIPWCVKPTVEERNLIGRKFEVVVAEKIS
jgi:hypothetical protein